MLTTAEFFVWPVEDACERHEPREVLALLKQMDVLSQAQAAHLDVCFLHWVFQVLRRKEDREGILEAQSLLELATALCGEKDQKSHFCVRWEAFNDLLESQRRTLACGGYGSFESLTEYQKKILAVVPLVGGTTQLQLATTMKWSPLHTTHMLSALESRGKITRKKVGDDYLIELPK